MKPTALLPENPVDYLVRKTGLSRGSFTRKHDLGANTLLLLSQGRKESVSPKVFDALGVEAQAKGLDLNSLLAEQYGTTNLARAYDDWIKEARQVTDLKVVIPRDLTMSPWAAIVDQVGSVSAMSKLLRVRFIAVRKYLNSPTMPEPIREALNDIGWTGIDRLDKAQQKYFSA